MPASIICARSSGITADWFEENLRFILCCSLIRSLPSFTGSMFLESSCNNDAKSSNRAFGGRSVENKR